MKKPWQKQESRLAQLTGGQRTPGSGNGWMRKNDVRSFGELVEAKWTSHKSFVLKLDELRQLEHHAVIQNRRPVFAIEFQERIGPGHTVPRRYVVLLEDDYYDDDPHHPR